MDPSAVPLHLNKVERTTVHLHLRPAPKQITMPTFSIIIPVYNVAPYLRACLDSVIAAVGGAAVEIICVDDGSTDGCGAILDEYAERFNSSNRGSEHVPGEEGGNASDVHLHLLSPPPNSPVFRILHQKNAGVSAARNAALKVASGEWVVFVDADDVVAPNYFSVLVDAAQSHGEVDLLAFGYVEFNEKSSPMFCDPGLPWQVVDVSDRLPMTMIDIDLWRAAFRRAVMPAHWFRPYCRGEDMLFVSECLCKARLVGSNVAPLYGYRVRRGSAMRSRMSIPKLEDRIGYIQERVTALKNSGKKIDRFVYRVMGLKLTENFIEGILMLESCADQDKMWMRWYESLKWVGSETAFPLWTRAVAKVCRLCQWRWLAMILCYMPLWLKKQGIHR